MPLSYEIQQDAGYIKITGNGTLSVDEYVAINQSIADDPKCSGLERRLYDMCTVETASTYARQNTLNERTKESSGKRIAILVESQAGFGMARIYQALADHITIKIFYDEPKALNWLLSQPE